MKEINFVKFAVLILIKKIVKLLFYIIVIIFYDIFL